MTLKNIKTFTLAGAVALLTLFAGCKKPTYYQLTEDDMTWLHYDNNEVLTFSNGTGGELRYYVTLRTKAYTHEGDTYSEFTTADVLQLNDTTALFAEDAVGGMFIFTTESGLLVSFSWPHFALDGVPLTSMIPTAQTIGGIIYSDVYELNASGLTDLRNYNRKIWVSKTEGVLQIEDVSGNIWVREF